VLKDKKPIKTEELKALDWTLQLPGI